MDVSVKFLETRILQGNRIYAKDDVYVMSRREAEKWLRAGAAEIVVAAPCESSATEEAEAREVEQQFVRPYGAVHRGFGKYDVVDANGSTVNDTPLTKMQAAAMAGPGDDAER